MVVSLRAAQPSSRSFRKGYSYSTCFRPIYATSLNPPVDAFSDLPPSNQLVHEIGASADPSSCEFWCSSRLKSRLNQQPFPQIKVPKPWAPIAGRGKGDPNADPSSSPPSQSAQASGRDGFPSTETRALEGLSPAHMSPSNYLLDTIQKKTPNDSKYGIENWAISEKSPKPLSTPLTWKQRRHSQQTEKRTLQKVTADFIQFVGPVLRDSDYRPEHELSAFKLDKALVNVVRGSYMEYLESRQYDITDVMAWAWVLMSTTTYEAILRIFCLEAYGSVDKPISHRNVPVFIPLMLLRQETDLKTFRLLLVYSLYLIIGRPIPRLNDCLRFSLNNSLYNDSNDHHANDLPRIDASTCATIVVRLLSHARRLWPEAQLPIAQAFAFYLRTQDSQHNRFLIKKLDRFIQLLALPPGPRPFISASIRQQAQFELLKAMAEIHPASPISRRGYQGLAAVQLAHRKTAAEREFAELKTPSWPPWKEERSGMDADKGVEGTRSRASRVLLQMREAGHSFSLWEDVANILAGWDTDNSPMIQTRALARQPKHLYGLPKQENHRAIWEARIRSTRTLREAWAAFMAYESRGLPPHRDVYHAMGERLVFVQKERNEQKAKINRSLQTRIALPGDGPEVFPEPASARDWIYTPTEPPTLYVFLRRMLSQGIRPSGRFLALLLHHAPRITVALDCLSVSDLTNQQLRVLFSLDTEISDTDAESSEVLDALPEYLFAAFIRLLCKFSTVTRKSTRWVDEPRSSYAFPILTNSWQKSDGVLLNSWSRSQTRTPTLFLYTAKKWGVAKPLYAMLLSHAVRLLRKRKSQKPQAWIQLLAGLRSQRIVGESDFSRHVQMIIAWHEILEVTKWLDERNIELGPDGFQILCQSFSAAVTAGVIAEEATKKGLEIVHRAAQRSKNQPDVAPPSFEDLVSRGLTTLKSQFDRLVLLEPKTFVLFDTLSGSLEKQTGSQVAVPTMNHVPAPAILHAFVRSLGLAEDSEGLLNLLRWMSKHAMTLKQTSDEYTNGDLLMRRTVVAVRMFLEGYWGRRPAPAAYEPDTADYVTPSDFDVPKFSDPALQEAYDIVTETEVWGPWPSDEEVRDYFEHGQQ
ncbi:uncharacterized protein DSM5745_03216 [Aspergillus mulundensis]|uniref:Uncharacterized protein n=1 Tax=Aspergillus mulundensis TaxID=1810919 RepID=A0A3D8SK44_9EURO|nr:Uncharacterized protein DSM5745_03216 [Aspergillus mulundensis]RDW86574.1 Uncharacterized protein DSM5745_03216 [Aspergillus mulundensis]